MQSSAKCKLKPRDLIPVRIITIKKTKTARVVKDVETPEPSGIFCEMHNGAAAGDAPWSLLFSTVASGGSW